MFDVQDSAQALMLGLAGETFAIDARLVREILDPTPVTRIPGAKPFVSSVLNFRGKVIPLADLRLRLGLAPAPITPDSRFVVIETEVDGDEMTVGVVADRVYEVAELEAATLQKSPPVGMRWRPEFVAGIAMWKDEFIVLPDLNRILSSEGN